MYKTINGLGLGRTGCMYVFSFLVFILICSPTYGQKKKKKQLNWIEQKHAQETKWRVGAGVHMGTLTGVHGKFYKMRNICTSNMTCQKKLSLDISLSQEGLMFHDVIAMQEGTWQKRGTRFGIDFRLFAPSFFNPYIGLGLESGSRSMGNSTSLQSDMVFRLGAEQKLFHLRPSRKTVIIVSGFLEGKYNYCISADFKYLSPTFGIRFHYI